MENEKPESVLDICQKIRDAGIPGLADHLEAAWKQEREALEAHVRSLQSQLKVAYSCGEQPRGDAAAMREALIACLDFIMRLDRAFNPFMQNLLEKAIAKANAALSAPARNCDLYQDKKDAEVAFVSEECSHPCGNCTVGDKYGSVLAHECGVEWLFAPAAERKGEGDGK